MNAPRRRRPYALFCLALLPLLMAACADTGVSSRGSYLSVVFTAIVTWVGTMLTGGVGPLIAGFVVGLSTLFFSPRVTPEAHTAAGPHAINNLPLIFGSNGGSNEPWWGHPTIWSYIPWWVYVVTLLAIYYAITHQHGGKLVWNLVKSTSRFVLQWGQNVASWVTSGHRTPSTPPPIDTPSPKLYGEP